MLFWCRLIQNVLEKKLLNVCGVVVLILEIWTVWHLGVRVPNNGLFRAQTG